MSFLKSIASSDILLFWRRWLQHPAQTGALAPSSHRLAACIARQVQLNPGEFALELGAGTGRLTQALLQKIPSSQLIVVEKDAALCERLRQHFPALTIIHGDAINLTDLLPQEVVGSVAYVISGIPFRSLPRDICQQIIQASLNVMGPQGCFLQFTYILRSPLPENNFDLEGRWVDYVIRNIPPAVIWRYQRNLTNLAKKSPNS